MPLVYSSSSSSSTSVSAINKARAWKPVEKDREAIVRKMMLRPRRMRDEALKADEDRGQKDKMTY